MYKIIQSNDEVILVEPHISLKNEYLDMLTEWKEDGGELIPWSLNLETTKFSSLVEDLKGYSKGINLPDGFVPFTTLWLVNGKGKVLGVIEIRHNLNEYLAFRGGHIGYGIRPSERCKGYGNNMLRMALQYCKIIGLTNVLLTCLKNNVGSIKTITKNRGIINSEDIDGDEHFQRYWIKLN